MMRLLNPWQKCQPKALKAIAGSDTNQESPDISKYRKISNIRHTFIGNEIVDHSDVVGASPVGAAPTTSSFSTKHIASMNLDKDNCKTRRETFKFWDLVQLILETWR